MESKIIIQNVERFVALILAQLLILNNVNISGFAIPYLYVLFILMLPTDTPRNWMLLLSFLCGLSMDIFSNMLGFHSFACTLVAMMRILFADKILTRNEGVTITTPSIHTVNPQSYIVYLLVLLLIFYFTFFLLELFDRHEMWQILLSAVLSTILTGLLALMVQFLFIKRNK